MNLVLPKLQKYDLKQHQADMVHLCLSQFIYIFKAVLDFEADTENHKNEIVKDFFKDDKDGNLTAFVL